jgi:glycosyltransferase involved in cell wall biosynthesis
LDVAKQVKRNTKNIIFYGRISLDKGTDLLLDMFAKLVKDVPDCKLFISGFSLDDLEERLKRRGIKNIFFLGRLQDEELKKVLEKCPIYVNLARIDPASVAVLEVMRGGTIPVVSANVGNNYIVREISKSLVVRRPDEAAVLITRLLGHPELLRRYSLRAIRLAQKYDRQASVKLFKVIMGNFIKNGKTGGTCQHQQS